MNKIVINDFKQCICEMLIEKYNLSEIEAIKAIRDSYFSESLKISEHDTLHLDPEVWADDIYEYICEEPQMVEM